MNVQTALQRATLVTALASLCACAGAPKASFEPAAAPAPQQRPHGTARALLAFTIRGPAAKNPPGPVTGFIAPSTDTVVVKIAGKTIYRSPDVSTYIRFSDTFSVPSGVDTIEVDLMYGGTNPLSRGFAKLKMPSGVTTPIAVDLHGVAVKVKLVTAQPYPPVGRPVTERLHLVATDQAYEVIDRGTYEQPFTVKTQNGSPHVKIRGLTFDRPADVGTIAYDGRTMSKPIFFTVAIPPATSPSATIFFLANSFRLFPHVAADDITFGPGGAIWFSDCRINGRCSIDYMKPDGTNVIVGSAPWVQSLVEGPDGNMWFTEGEMKPRTTGPTIGRITPKGKVTEFRIYKSKPHIDYGTFSIVAGRDGALWFTEVQAVGRITTDGTITQYPVHIPGPIRSTSLVESDSGTFYFDGIPYSVVAFNPKTGTATQLGDYYHRLSGPLVWTKAGLLAGGNAGEALVDASGLQHPVRDYPDTVVRLNSGGELWGTTLVPGLVPLIGFSVQTLEGYNLRGPAYAVPPPASQYVGTGKIIGRGDTYWESGSQLVRFTYNP